MKRSRIFRIGLVDTYLVTLVQHKERQQAVVGLSSAMHRRQLIVHPGVDIAAHLHNTIDQGQVAQTHYLVNRLHFFRVPMGH